MEGEHGDDRVGGGADDLGDVGRSDRHGEDDPRRLFAPDGLERGQGGDTGGEPVVDHDHVAAGQATRGRPSRSAHPLVDTGPFGGGEPDEAFAVDTAVVGPLSRHDLHAALGDGADAELGLLRVHPTLRTTTTSSGNPSPAATAAATAAPPRGSPTTTPPGADSPRAVSSSARLAPASARSWNRQLPTRRLLRAPIAGATTARPGGGALFFFFRRRAPRVRPRSAGRRHRPNARAVS